METAIIVSAVTSAAMAAAQGMQASSQASAEAKAADYNATVLKEQGQAESAAAGANMGANIRETAGVLGEQAAAIGQANIGTGGSAQAVEKQSATNARMDALNIWYGGELAAHQANAAAEEQKYRADIYRSNATSDLFGGGIGAGTKLLMGGTNAYLYSKGLPMLGTGGSPYGGSDF